MYLVLLFYIVLCRRAAPFLSLSLDLISTIDSNCCSSLLSLLRRRRALDGGALPDLPHRTCGSTVERSYVRPSFEGFHGDQDLFVGVYTFTLLQLSINSSAAREV